MCTKLRFLTILIGLSLSCSVFAQSTIEDAVNLLGQRAMYEADMSPTDTLIDSNNDYLAVISGRGSQTTTLFEAKIYPSKEATSTLITTSINSDMQCTSYRSRAYQLKKQGIEEVPIQRIFPLMGFEELVEKNVSTVLLKYLEEIQNNYLGKEADVDQVMGEVYDPHFILSKESNDIEVEATICDYIPTNEVEISTEDWQVIENSTNRLKLEWDEEEMNFVLLDLSK